MIESCNFSEAAAAVDRIHNAEAVEVEAKQVDRLRDTVAFLIAVAAAAAASAAAAAAVVTH